MGCDVILESSNFNCILKDEVFMAVKIYTVNSFNLATMGLDICWIIKYPRLSKSTYNYLSSYRQFFFTAFVLGL